MTQPETQAAVHEEGEPTFSFIPAAWSPGAALWLLVLVFGVSALGSLTARAIIARPLSDLQSSVLVGGTLAVGYLIELVVVSLVSRSRGIGFSASVGLIRPDSGGTWVWVILAVLGALAARGIASLYAGLMQLLPVELPGADANPLTLFPGGGFSAVILVLVVVVIAPFAEEVVFRGVLLPAFGARWGAFVGVAASSALFAGLHFSAYVLFPIAVAALLFALLVVRFRSLWPAYLAHATFNGIAVVLLIVLEARGLV